MKHTSINLLNHHKLIVITIVLNVFVSANSYKYLGLFPIPIKSHIVVFNPLMKELARRGHEVTVVSSFPDTTQANYRHIDLSEYMPKLVEVRNISQNVDTKLTKYLTPVMLSQMADIVCNALSLPEIQNLLQEIDDYDAIITESFNTDCFLGVASRKNVIIGFSTSGLLPWTNQYFGNPRNPAYIPNVVLDLTDGMSFLQRLENTVVTFVHNLFYTYYRQVKDEYMINRYVGINASTVNTISRNLKLLLVNTHFSLNFARPFPPNVIEVGGIHIQEQKPLPMDLKKWVEDSSHGVIFFSMGSMAKGQTFPKREAFVRAFERLPQRVVWKWENRTMEGKTDKILIQRWLPQSDLLCHPNVKLFVSHGGLIGVLEAVHCGVPILIIPQYGDQHHNARSVEAAGAGVILRLNDITEESAYDAVVKAMQLESKMKEVSMRFKDRPLPPLESAVYWSEYVVRHKGASFMQTGAVKLPFYQYYLLDVLAFIAILMIISLYLTYLFFKLVKKTCINDNNNKKQKKE